MSKPQYNIGLMYADGEGVKQDYGEAVKWYRMAAEQGLALAQNNMGFMYANGRGVPKDFAAAHMWLTLAAAQGEPNAQKTRDIVIKLMTHGQIEEANLMAREWKAKHPQ